MQYAPTTDRSGGGGRLTAALLAVSFLAAGCAGTDSGQDPTDRYDQGSTTEVSQFIDYKEGPTNLEGPTSIRTLLDLDRQAPVWYGYAPDDPYPTGGEAQFKNGSTEACETQYQNKVYAMDELPMVIEGVVTLVPQHYEKRGFCGQDHRYYGSYFLQDATGSILVLKDSRVSDFDFGDRVKLRVRGVKKSFGTLAVTAFDEMEIDREPTSVPFQKLTKSYTEKFGTSDSNMGNVPEGLGDNYRVTGRVCQAPVSRNFSEMILQKDTSGCSDDDTSWTVSLGLELGRRGVGIERGEVVTVTGPVNLDFSYLMIATQIGQIQRFNAN